MNILKCLETVIYIGVGGLTVAGASSENEIVFLSCKRANIYVLALMFIYTNTDRCAIRDLYLEVNCHQNL